MRIQIKYKIVTLLFMLGGFYAVTAKMFKGADVVPQQTEVPATDTVVQQAPPQPVFKQQGVASYYASKFNGRRTASGERYSGRKLTAAHRTLPFGTLVRVADAKTGRWLVVKINDRGPHNRRRIIDLSYEAARQLGMTKGGGLLKVKIRVVEWPGQATTR